jgi:hypothetical protein
LIFEFPPDRFRHTPTFVGMNYTDDLILLDLTFIEGRSKEKRLSLLQDLSQRVSSAAKLSPDDLVITIYEAPGENFSFGRGGAQRAYKVTTRETVFDGVRSEVTTTARFNAVIQRLRDGMGETSIPEIVEIAQKSFSEAEYRRIVQERFRQKKRAYAFLRDRSWWLAVEIRHQPVGAAMHSRQSASSLSP